ncbi:HR-like lesion-inducer [Olea europaea subsp. europaea]|uniref:HR-like lesion-inducer n=1 Tax=Olea europaea subsp. europaea TaxID=158383 RepID=A0A8S0PPA5_OLEEU|nr:HR-like lesion-inducer [Olea europaea subsp. europaea]
MAFISFVGRVVFVSVFVLSAYQEFNEFGVDGGRAAKSLRPKFDVFAKHITSHTGYELPHVEGLGSLLFIFGSSLGAFILLLYQVIAITILYDFYNYDADKKQFVELFVNFTQGLALLGALLFFIGMKNSISRRSSKKKVAPKVKIT